MILTYYIAFTMLLIAYLLGSIPSAVWIGKKYYGIDIREYGSKNAGTTNMLRVLGRRAALPVFALDVLKGFVAVTIVDLIKYDDFFAGNAHENWFYILRFAAIFAALNARVEAHVEHSELFGLYDEYRHVREALAQQGVLTYCPYRFAFE